MKPYGNGGMSIISLFFYKNIKFITMASTFMGAAGFIAKNGLPVLAAGETMGKVAADFVDVMVNDLFMPGLYKLSVLSIGGNPYAREKIEGAFKSVKKEIDTMFVLAAFLKFFFAILAVYIVLGVILKNIGNLSTGNTPMKRLRRSLHL
jgi:hypothetical protein